MPTVGERLREEQKANGIKWYQPHQGQLPFHKSSASIRCLFGGNRSGKTEAMIAEAVMWAIGDQRFRKRRKLRGGTIWLGAESTEVQREVLQVKLLKLLPKNLIKKIYYLQRGIIDFVELTNGVNINLKNYEQGADKWASKDVDFIGLDEEPPREIFVECKMRTIDRGGEIVISMTPVNGMTWVFTDLYEMDGRNGIECFVMDMEINPHINKVERDRVLAGLSAEEKLIRGQGKFVALAGLIYPEFKEDLHVIPDVELPMSWRRVCAIDPHLKKDTAVLWAAMANEQLGQIKRGDWVFYREAKKKGETPAICSMIQIAQGPKEKIYVYVIDPAKPNIQEEWPGQSLVDAYASQGIPVMMANKAVEQGVHAVRERLQSTPPTIWIFQSCRDLIWEFKHYMYSDPTRQDGKAYSEKILKREDDLIDCCRYIVNTGIKPTVFAPPIENRYIYNKTGRIIGVRQ